MKRTLWLISVFTTTAVAAPGQERKLTRQQLPAAVAATVDRETRGAVVRGYATEREQGARVYEAETIVAGHTRDLQIAEDGTLKEVEEEVAREALPMEVRAALATRAKGAQIAKVESITKKGTLAAYEATLMSKNKKMGEVQVGPHGEALTRKQ